MSAGIFRSASPKTDVAEGNQYLGGAGGAGGPGASGGPAGAVGEAYDVFDY
jgi:hypothetical protein